MDPTSEIINDIIKKKYQGRTFNSELTEGGSDIRLV